MKVLTLHQPWATLIALGMKTIETRGERTMLKERIAIHAASRSSHRQRDLFDVDLGELTHLYNERQGNGWYLAREVISDIVPLPFGAIVATAELYDCVPIIDHTTCREDSPHHVCTAPSGALYRHLPISGPLSEITSEWPHHGELPFGDYRPGRWAWLLRDVRPLDEPAPFVGGQGWSRSWEPTL